MSITQKEKEIGRRFETLAKELKQGKGDIAKAIGVDESLFSRMLKGKSGVSVDIVIAVSSIFGVRLEWLLYGEKPIIKEKSGALQQPDHDLLTLRKLVDSAILNLQEASKMLPEPLGPGTDVGRGTGFQEGKKNRTGKPLDT